MHQYRNTGILMRFLIGFFVGLIAIYAMRIAISAWDIGIYQRELAGVEVPDDEIDTNLFIDYLVSLAFLGVQITIVVLFCVFVNVTSKNARALGSEGMRFSPGWTVGYFFIPIINLFRPYQAVTEIVKASDPDVAVDSQYGWRESSSAITGWWWAAWLIGWTTKNVSIRLSRRQSLEDWIVAEQVFIFSGCLLIIAAILAICVVYTIHNRQTRRAANRAQALTVPPPRSTPYLPGDIYNDPRWQ